MTDSISRRAFGRVAAGLAAGAMLAHGAAPASTAHAQTSISTTRDTITLDAAQVLIAAAIAKAQELGVPMAIAIVDESGVLKAFARMEGTSLASVDLVQAKAFTSAAFRAPTHVLAERNQNDPTRLASLPNFPRVTLLGGGYPIQSGTSIVGGIGVGGGSAQQDMAVAEAALAALG
ncbi:MAG: heme-binding protein [Chloroflexi bacterium]|nr:heme-binding protein [Chloroflexota bacterium]